ncbi:MAG: spore germination protein [Clostridia bacterium]|nr:spore germination protein [Clostridia bacterium]
MVTLEKNIKGIKDVLTSQDILVFEFQSSEGKRFAAIYADGIADKQLLGELVVKPLREVKKDAKLDEVKMLLASPEVKDCKKIKDGIAEVSDGNAVLFVDGEKDFFIIGLKNPPGRSVAEPPTQITLKGPREGFTEDIKVNLGLVRKRLKSDKLHIKMLKSGQRSDTAVAMIYLDDVVQKDLPEDVEKRILNNEIDLIPDSSYIAQFISKKPKSLFKRNGTSEKPDIFCAKICEGRVGLIVDGSPIALTVPYILTEDLQAAEDYYAVSYRSTIIRILRVLSLVVGMFLPAMYISAQLFKIQLIPFQLLLKISSSISSLPLSPSVEMFLTLFVLEVLNEASIRMPKYVGLALSVVGALVLGDTAVKAGIISTPAIIIIAFSAICLYTTPDLVETTATLRWILLIVSGSIGPFGIVLFTAFIICYLVTEQSYGAPLLAPFAPVVKSDLYDSMVKANMNKLNDRPRSYVTRDKVRFKAK